MVLAVVWEWSKTGSGTHDGLLCRPLEDYINPHGDDNLHRVALNAVQPRCVTQVYMAGGQDVQRSDARQAIKIKPYEQPMNAVDLLDTFNLFCTEMHYKDQKEIRKYLFFHLGPKAQKWYVRAEISSDDTFDIVDATTKKWPLREAFLA